MASSTETRRLERPLSRSIGGSLLLIVLIGTSADGADSDVRFLVDPQGFDDSAADIEAVCRSAGRQIWRETGLSAPLIIEVTRSEEGPISLFRRGGQGEYRIRLDTGGQAWSQYAYQFAHELCHVLSGYEDDDPGNLWFEETLCETASLYSLRRMGREWRTDPPYENWAGYAPSLRDYATDVICSRGDLLEIARLGLPTYYRRHADYLRKHPTDRGKNGAMAVVLLLLFEREPDRWEAIRWLNSSPSPEGETFEQYLRKWRSAVPKRHREFVDQIGMLYGFDLSSAVSE